MRETIRLFCDYTAWADARMFDALAPLSPDAWTRDLGGSLKSVRDTAVHLVGAEWLYLSRLKGVSPTATWDPADFPDPASLRRRWAPLAAELVAFGAARSDEELLRPLSYRNLKGDALSLPLGHVALQLTNHSTYHRGQVSTMLRQLRATPLSTDLVVWWSEKHRMQ